jgi:hypothetical protein
MAGAHLMDLALAGRVRLEDDVVVVADGRPTGDGPLDATLSEIAGEEPRSPKDWIERRQIVSVSCVSSGGSSSASRQSGAS